jgi:hypothetical protein
VFLVNSRLGLFTATRSRGHPFSRTYGAILPSSLERVISRPLVFSTSLPVSVSGTGPEPSSRRSAFLGTIVHHAEVVTSSQSSQGMASCHASPITLQFRSPGILTWCPSTTPFGLALGPDSPSADEPSGGTLRVSGCMILTYIFATQADILTSIQSTPALANASTRIERSSTTCINTSPQLRYNA